MAGILSGPNALEALSCLVAEFNSEKRSDYIQCIRDRYTWESINVWNFGGFAKKVLKMS